jgi:hypothetical protein
MERLERRARELSVLKGSLARWLLPFDTNTAASDQSSVTESVLENEPGTLVCDHHQEILSPCMAHRVIIGALSIHSPWLVVSVIGGGRLTPTRRPRIRARPPSQSSRTSRVGYHQDALDAGTWSCNGPCNGRGGMTSLTLCAADGFRGKADCRGMLRY